MFKTNEIIRRWHIAGFFWIVIVGSLLHFTYEWSGKSTLVGYFSPVNESLWEHLKLGYFSLSFFILIELGIKKQDRAVLSSQSCRDHSYEYINCTISLYV